MGAITIDGILRAEHDVLHDAICGWCGIVDDRASQDLQYVCGVHDMAHKLIEMLEADNNGEKRE